MTFSTRSKAIKNMFALLSPKGRLLVTVPYGKEENHGWLRNYHEERWQKILNLTGETSNIKEWYFRHTQGRGWQLSTPEELTYAGYYDQNNYGASGLAAALIQK